ncbi:hypothetical protein COCON_G00094730 [Conger conger]|uniref:Uncharacterized protein n=1 Tax=Conger conger TaxID=82655 RepID=A0A9Q1DLY5_CONCO|nr:hypothetical protein COCON_G00094730 [Conger conger]
MCCRWRLRLSPEARSDPAFTVSVFRQPGTHRKDLLTLNLHTCEKASLPFLLMDPRLHILEFHFKISYQHISDSQTRVFFFPAETVLSGCACVWKWVLLKDEDCLKMKFLHVLYDM